MVCHQEELKKLWLSYSVYTQGVFLTEASLEDLPTLQGSCRIKTSLFFGLNVTKHSFYYHNFIIQVCYTILPRELVINHGVNIISEHTG